MKKEYYDYLCSRKEKYLEGEISKKEYGNMIVETYISALNENSEEFVKEFLDENELEIFKKDDQYCITINEDVIFDRRNTGKQLSVSISINPTEDTNYFADPYFKVYDGNHSQNSQHINRISIMDSRYVLHNYGENWSIPNSILKDIVDFYDSKNKDGITNWEYLCNKIKEKHESMHSKVKLCNFPKKCPRYNEGIVMPKKK